MFSNIFCIVVHELNCSQEKRMLSKELQDKFSKIYHYGKKECEFAIFQKKKK